MELEAVYSYLYLRSGKRREGEPPGLAVATSLPTGKPARGRSRDTLFIHLTLSSRAPPSAALYHAVTEALVNAYFLSGGSVTAALRQSIRAANEYLMRHNVRAQGVDKQQGGITCAVLREEEVFIAQAGPALAFIAHQGRLERLPPRRPGHVTPLGMGYGVDTRFYHSWAHPGDVLLLAEQAFEKYSNESVGTAVIYEGVTAGINNLAQLAAEDEQTRSLLVEFAADAQRVVESEPEPPAPTPEPAALPPAEPPPTTPPRRSIEVDVEGGARKVTSALALGLARLTGGVGRMLERLFGASTAGGQAVKKNQGPSPAALGLLAVIVPVLVALIVVAVYMQRGRAAQFQELLLHIDEESQLALAAGGDQAAACAHWERIMEMSEEALRLRPSHETVLQFRTQARDALDVLDEITRLTVRSLYSYRGGGVPAALTAQSLAVYVLDTDLNHVYKHLLESDLQAVDGMEPETLLFKGQAVGGEAVGDLVDLVWFPKSGEIREETVAILDANGLLLRYRPSWGNVLSSPLKTPAAWADPVAISIYGDRLYVLDVGARQVWKFDAQDGGYPQEPTTYRFLVNEDGNPTNDVDLGQMLDMTIDRDGNLYLLGSDGVVYKFFNGERRPFSLIDFQEPLVAPSAIFCSLTGLNPFFYIADPGSGRIAQTTQQGLLWAQYRAEGVDLTDPFTHITGIYVQETPLLRIYATGGNDLIVASLE